MQIEIKKQEKQDLSYLDNVGLHVLVGQEGFMQYFDHEESCSEPDLRAKLELLPQLVVATF